MIKFVYKSIRPNLETKWYQRSEQVQKLADMAKDRGDLINEEFEYKNSGLIMFTTSIWSNREAYSDHVNSPEMLEWRLNRSIYNSVNNISFELYAKIEDWM